MRKPTRTNLVLGATSLALALALGAQLGGTSVLPSAYAQPKPGDDQPDTPFNAMEQRKQMIVQLTEMNRRLTTIEQKITTGLSVKVTEMPDVRLKDQARK